jgi:ATP-binding cassette subfamily C protein
MVTVVYLFQATIEVIRSRILSHIGSALDLEVSTRVQEGIHLNSLRGKTLGDGLTPMRDLDHIRTFLSGPGPAALVDLPWIIFFLAVLYLLHFWLGFTATVGALVLVGITVATEFVSRNRSQKLTSAAAIRGGVADANKRFVESSYAMGMQGRLMARFGDANETYLSLQQELSKASGVLGNISKTFRIFLQSMVLTVGALLVINGSATGGVIFASSILAARALAPVDLAIANWRGFVAAREGWARLNQLLTKVPKTGVATALPAPTQGLQVEQLAIVPPGSDRPAVQDVTFSLSAGDTLGIVGPSASGKSSLTRGIIGVWLPARGAVRLDGAKLDQWDPERLGEHLGYIPQTVQLLDGTIAQNISRFDPAATSELIIEAAKAAGIHDMILRLPNGYDTMIQGDSGALSSGQRQRVALARALYKEPFLVVLDEPNSNLDAEGDAALEGAVQSVRARGGIVIIVTHRPAALAQVDYIMFLRNGRMEAFGPRDEILNKIVAKRQASIGQNSSQGEAARPAAA